MHSLFAATLIAGALSGRAYAAQSTEAEQTALLGHDVECAPYGIPLTTNVLGQFPPDLGPGVPVTDVRNDTEGLAKFQSIEANIPKIAVRTATDTYDGKADPDCYWTETQCVAPKASGVNPDIFEVPQPKTLGYGFDDGPACDHNAFYNYLAEKKQTATMFYIGKNVMYYPLQAQRAVSDGHEICVHTWSHALMTRLSNEQAFAELWYTIKIIKLVTGVTPTCWRVSIVHTHRILLVFTLRSPPQGDVDDRIRFIAQSLDLQTIGSRWCWRSDSFDWAAADPSQGVTAAQVQANYDTLMASANNGDLDTHGAIFLMHENSNFTMQTAVNNYPKLMEAFDYLTPVGVALNKTGQQTFAAYAKEHPASGSTGAASGSSSGSTGISGNTANTNSTKNSTSSGSTSSDSPSGEGAGVALSPRLGFATLLVGALVFAAAL
ncbi:Carbohydrate esterase family 4 protein [Mycena kentingensis (nom. inval.)]|nr:Carbohydrate esterase family 4 protein [Mycena kentingensis (nom. inval.)]